MRNQIKFISTLFSSSYLLHTGSLFSYVLHMNMGPFIFRWHYFFPTALRPLVGIVLGTTQRSDFRFETQQETASDAPLQTAEFAEHDCSTSPSFSGRFFHHRGLGNQGTD